MNNQLAIDYFRIDTERGLDSWNQDYVKMPLSEPELKKFGGVLGIVTLVGKEAYEKGNELIGEIENYVSEEGNQGKVTELITMLKKSKAEGIFCWVVSKDGSRVVKVGGTGKMKAVLIRGKKKTTLVKAGMEGVVTGKLLEDDFLLIGRSELVETMANEEMDGDFEELSTRIKEKEVPGAGLVLKVKGLEAVDEVVEEKLVSNEIVGATGFRKKVAQAQIGLSDLKNKLNRGLPLDRKDHDKRHKWLVFVGTGFLVALFVSVGLGLIKAKNDKLAADFKSVYEPWDQKRKEALDLFSLNPVGARELLRSVKDEVAAKKSKFAGGPYEGKINDLENALETAWSKVSGEVKVTPELFFNLALIRTNLIGDRIGYDEKQILVLDQNLGVVAGVNFNDQKSAVILGKGEGQGWLDVAGYKDNLVVLKNKGLTTLLSGKAVDTDFDASVTTPAGIEVFGQAAYILDTGASEVWRYGLTGQTIGERRRWMAVGVDADLRQTVDLALDGDIYTLDSSGKVMRLRRGQIEQYKLTDLPTDFSPIRIAVAADVDMIALLDKSKSRVVLFNKESGGYVKQLMADEFGKAKDLVWINNNILMVLSEGKLLKIGL